MNIVDRILKGQYVDLCDLLQDNLLLSKKTAGGGCKGSESSSAHSHRFKKWEFTRDEAGLLSWVQCFAVYTAIMNRIVPVHPDDRWLLGMKWRNMVYIDTVLPFGLHSVPKVFNTLADSLEWILHDMGVEHTLHYLDEFSVHGKTGM